MTVTLNEQTQEMVERELKEGGFGTAEELVNQVLQDHLSSVLFDDEALKASLIEALKSPRHVLPEGGLLERAKRRLAEQKAVIA